MSNYTRRNRKRNADSAMEVSYPFVVCALPAETTLLYRPPCRSFLWGSVFRVSRAGPRQADVAAVGSRCQGKSSFKFLDVFCGRTKLLLHSFSSSLISSPDSDSDLYFLKDQRLGRALSRTRTCYRYGRDRSGADRGDLPQPKEGRSHRYGRARSRADRGDLPQPKEGRCQ
jgi:hypothetical protein